MMFYLGPLPEDYQGWHAVSTSAEWEPWLTLAIPRHLDREVKRRLKSNLKHILVGLEMKAGLIVPHGARVLRREVLFEPYFNVLTLEFNVGVFSVCEGLGAAHHLAEIGNDGSAAPRVAPADWTAALARRFDTAGHNNLANKVAAVKNVRDKLHQDRLGARNDIDWHSFGYEAFAAAKATLEILLSEHVRIVPRSTNLIIIPQEYEDH